jgi:large subunit ribosomal protein L4
MKLPLYNLKGESTGTTDASDAVFSVEASPDLLHQALVYYQSNQRQGSSNTLTRAKVSGGGRKPFAQKGTGRARQGSTRSPLQRHGGVVFGPHPRSYRQRMPKRMRRKAILGALSGKAAAERIFVVDGLEGIEPKTKTMVELLGVLGIKGSALVVMHDEQTEVARATRNIPRTKALRAELLNMLDLMRYDALVMTVGAVRQAETLWTDIARIKPKADREAAA